MAPVYRVVLAASSFVGIMGLGVGLFWLMTPSNEEILEMRKKVNAIKGADLRSQNEELLKLIEEASKTNVNVASNPQWNSRR